MSQKRKRKCKHGTTYFRFDFPLSSEGVFFDNLTIDGYACMEGPVVYADIDSIEFRGVEVKPLLEILGAMYEIDLAAEDHAKGLFEISQLQIR